MAWSIVGVSAVVEVASGDITPTEPTGAASGDLLVACVAYRSNVAFAMPAGWTEIEVQNTGDTDATDGIPSCVMAYMVRGGSAPDYTFTRTLGDVAMASVVAYRGQSGSPLGVHSSETAAVATNTPTTPGLTTGAAESLIVAMMAAGDGRLGSVFDAATDPTTASGSTPNTTTAPTNGTWIIRLANFTSTGADTGLSSADAVRATAGATGTIQCTTGGNPGRHCMAAVEFRISTAAASDGDLAVTLDPITLAATGSVTMRGSLAVTIGDVVLSATGNGPGGPPAQAGAGSSTSLTAAFKTAFKATFAAFSLPEFPGVDGVEHLLDELGNFLTDEFGNQLTGRVG